MTNRVKELIADFKAKGWKMERPYERLFEIVQDQDELFVFLDNYMKTFTESETLFNDGLHYINKEQFKTIIQAALTILQKESNNENAESAIDYAALQFPELLHDDLPLIFQLKVNENSYSAEYPWRNLKGEGLEYFKNLFISNATSLKDKQRLFRCLLETRNEEVINLAMNYATQHRLFDNYNGFNDYPLAYLELVGYTKQDNTIKSYCPYGPMHFVFSERYILGNRPMFQQQHPTWKLEPVGEQFKFGGVLEDDDKNPFFHIITLDPIPNGLNMKQLNRLVIGAHIREMNVYGPVFYQHDDNGNPVKIKTRQDDEMEFFEDNIIIQTNITLTPTPERWKFQSWGAANNRENLFRLGGEPVWIQGADVLTCPVCNAKMNFLLQLDTGLPTVTGEELMFGSGGVCYVFWCDESKVSGFTLQCT